MKRNWIPGVPIISVFLLFAGLTISAAIALAVTTTSSHKVESTISLSMSDTFEGITRQVAAGARASLTLTHGTAANQADDFVQDTARILTSGNNEDLDLYDLAGFDNTTDALGNTVTCAEIVAILIVNRSTSVGDCIVGNNATAAAWNSAFNGSDTGAVTIRPGGFFCLAAPTDPALAVTDTSNHLLRIAASGGDVTYDIYLVVRKS